ncbi:MAG: hypothetical protein FJX63_01655 [Alphaproteobacteria bacterium]|nr:hypothetical protein [Alphaproteobacteria bacterium]
MGNFVVALAIVIGGWWLLRKLGASRPAEVRRMMRKAMGLAIIGAGGLLLFRGVSNVGVPLMVLGAGMLGETTFFPAGIPWPGSPAPDQPRGPPPRPPQAQMTRTEALAVLGLKPGASAADVREAYRRLMKDYHPDKGGSDYLAAKINAAKDLLLQDLGATT